MDCWTLAYESILQVIDPENCQQHEDRVFRGTSAKLSLQVLTMSKGDQSGTCLASESAALEKVEASSNLDKDIVEEMQSTIEEKFPLDASHSKRKESGEDDARENATADSNASTDSRSSKGDPYSAFGLKESQGKALKAFRVKLEAALLKTKAAAMKLKDTSSSKEKQVQKEREKIEDKQTLAASESEGSAGERACMPLKETAEELSTPALAPSFREESYKVEDLKDFEKKALEALRLKVDEAIKSKMFFDQPKQKTCEKEEIETVTLDKGREGRDQPAGDMPAIKSGLPKEEVPAYAVEKGLNEDDSTQADAAKELSIMGDKRATGASPQSFYLWNIPIHNGDERTDVILMKFLRAKHFKVNEAFNMLKSTISWRKEFVPDSVIKHKSDHLSATDQQLESLVYMHGHDKAGHPVCYNHYGAFQNKEMYHKMAFEGDDQSKPNKLLRWRIQGLEKGLQKLDFTPGNVHSMVQVIDLGGSPATFLLQRPRIAKKAVSLLQDYYPELVAQQIVVNAPWYFPALHTVFSRAFTTAREKHKVVLARPGKSTETLFKYISPEKVPTKYGGLSRDSESNHQGDDPATQIIIKPGEQRAIELPVVEAGASLVWELSIVGWDVIYGEEFCPHDENDYSLIIQKSRKMGSKSHPISRSFTAPKSGKVLLTIDNSASKRKKTVVYRTSSTTTGKTMATENI